MTVKIERYLAENHPETPCLIVDLDAIADNYRTMQRLLPLARIFYAVKANPAPKVVAMLNNLGSSFDTASCGEIDLVLSQGASPDRISFGNTIKKQRDIAYAYEKGVRLFAFDSQAELEKLAQSAPGSRVFCRILMECGGAEWPLSRKFGCSPEMAIDLLIHARDLGLDPYGVSFHVGSQQTDISQWDLALHRTASMFSLIAKADLDLKMVNIGGGFPAKYRAEIHPIETYCKGVMEAMHRYFGNAIPEIIVEPGRSMVGDAGIIQAEVVLIAQKETHENKRWVYLDIGKFGGLAETMDEAIKYDIITQYDGGATAPVILAGPTCDSADILYEKTEYLLPVDLKIGDKVNILAAGAYTASYSAVNFNGFAPLKSVCI